MTSDDGIMMKTHKIVILFKQRLASLSKTLFLMLSSLFLFTFSLGAVSATELQAMDYSSLAGGKTQIVLTFSDSVAKPNSFSIDEPARIVLDFAGVHNQLAKKTQEINIGTTRSVSTVEAGNRTRMVVNLLKKSAYEIDHQGNIVKLTIAGSPLANVSASSNAGSRSVTDVDFRRGEHGEARLIVELNTDNSAIDVSKEPGSLTVELAGITLPNKLQRRLDVVDFATPVQTIESRQNGRNTQLVLSTKGNFEHLAYQSDKTLTIEVKPIAEQQATTNRRDQFGYKGEKLSLNFQNIEVRAVLQLLAEFTGLNLVTSDTVKGNVTLRLKNVPWDQALDIILKTKGLAMRQSGNVMLIAPAAEIAAREKQELEAQKQLVELEPLYSEIIEINFAKASEIAAIIDSGSKESSGAGISGFVSDRGSVTVDERTNSILIRDTADQLVQIRGLIDKLDIPVRQVLIESRIVIANNDFEKELGVRFGASARSRTLGAATSGSLGNISGTDDNNLLEVPSTAQNPPALDQDLNVNLPVNNPAGTLALALAKLPLGMILELELQAMQAEGKGEIISSPRVVTSNQQTALIQQGTEIPYQEASSSGSTSVSFKEAVLKLEVTPQITPDDHIVMDLEVNKDEVGEVFLGVPSIDTRSVKTRLLVENGETVVLGGIYEQSKINGTTRVPFFGDLPYVGFLFKSTSNEDTKRELLVFVTPKIIKDGLKF